jgi:hypothetical protein
MKMRQILTGSGFAGASSSHPASAAALAGCDAAQGIEAEFTKRSEVNWSGKPDPAQRGCAQKTNIKANTGFQPRMQSAVF